MKVHCFRLEPGTDIKVWLENWAKKEKITAAFLLSCIGSLSVAKIRYAGKKETTTIKKPLEIISMNGLFSNKRSHFHISVSDAKGKVTGGHLKEGCIVRTTAELVVGELKDLALENRQDAATGYPELRVKRKR